MAGEGEGKGEDDRERERVGDWGVVAVSQLMLRFRKSPLNHANLAVVEIHTPFAARS